MDDVMQGEGGQPCVLGGEVWDLGGCLAAVLLAGTGAAVWGCVGFGLKREGKIEMLKLSCGCRLEVQLSAAARCAHTKDPFRSDCQETSNMMSLSSHPQFVRLKKDLKVRVFPLPFY